MERLTSDHNNNNNNNNNNNSNNSPCMLLEVLNARF